MNIIAHSRRPFLAWVFGFLAMAAGVRGVEAAVDPARSDVVLAWNDVLIHTTWAAHDVQPDSGATAFLLAVMHGAMGQSIESLGGDASGAHASTAGASALRSPGTRRAARAPAARTAAPIGRAALTPSVNACGSV